MDSRNNTKAVATFSVRHPLCVYVQILLPSENKFRHQWEMVRKTYIFGIGFPTANRERGQRTGGGGGDMTYGLITCLKFFDFKVQQLYFPSNEKCCSVVLSAFPHHSCEAHRLDAT